MTLLPAYNYFTLYYLFCYFHLYEIASTNFAGGFTEWGPWSQCSKTCGSDSLRVRKRSCYNPFPFGGQNCSGSTTEVKTCLLPPCVDSLDAFLPYSQKLGPAGAVNSELVTLNSLSTTAL